MERELKIVRLLDPGMCAGCAFAQIAEVEDGRGDRSRMVQCGRLDCDNWDTVGATPVRSVTPLNG